MVFSQALPLVAIPRVAASDHTKTLEATLPLRFTVSGESAPPPIHASAARPRKHASNAGEGGDGRVDGTGRGGGRWKLAGRKISSGKCHETIGECWDDDGQGYGSTTVVNEDGRVS